MKRQLLPLLIFTTLFCSTITKAQGLQPQLVNPFGYVSLVESEDPLRFFDPANIGYPIGDVNQDGVEDFLQTTLVPVSSGENFINQWKSVIISYDANMAIQKYRVFDERFVPLGDLNNDGIQLLGAVSDNQTLVFLNFSDTPNQHYFDERQSTSISFSPDFEYHALAADFDEDNLKDVFICTGPFSKDNCLVIYGAPDINSVSYQQFMLTEFGLNTSLDTEFIINQKVNDSNTDILVFSKDDNSNRLITGLNITAEREIEQSWQQSYSSASFTPSNPRRYFQLDLDQDGELEILLSDDRELELETYAESYSTNPVCEMIDLDYSGPSVEVDTTYTLDTNCLIEFVFEGGDDNENNGIAEWEDGKLTLRFDYRTDREDFVKSEMIQEETTFIPRPFSEIRATNQSLSTFYVRAEAASRGQRGRAALKVQTNQAPQYEFTSDLEDQINKVAQLYRVLENQALDNGQFIPDLSILIHNGERLIRRDLQLSEGTGNLLNSFADFPIRQIDGLANRIDTERSEFWTSPGNRPAFLLGSDNFIDSFGYDIADASGTWWNNPSASNPDVLSPSEVKNFSVLADVSSSDTFGFEVNNIGDIDKQDGEELLVSYAPRSSNDDFQGWIYSPDQSGLGDPVAIVFPREDFPIGLSEVLNIGRNAKSVGDVNGDGFTDFAFGLVEYDRTGATSGAVAIYAGQAFTDGGDPDTLQLIQFLGPVLQDGQMLNQFGDNFSGGDFDGDGFSDLAVVGTFASGAPRPPAIQVFRGGENMDAELDFGLYVRSSDVNSQNEFPSFLSSFYGDAVLSFLPATGNEIKQDLYFAMGAKSGYPDAVIYEGGTEPDSLPAYQLAEPGFYTTGSGLENLEEPVTGDFNNDGILDIVVEKQYDNRDGVISSKLLFYSPGSGIQVSNEETQQPGIFELRQNYPNPFNPTTNIQFELPVASNVTLRIYNVLGQEVATLLNNERLTAGLQTVPFNASNLASGVYIYRLEADGFVKSMKMLLIK